MPTANVLDIEEIKRILPQRYPLLFIDRVIEVSKEKVVAIKNVTMNEKYFQGHFPDEAVMPGALLIEAMAQAAIILYWAIFDRTERLFLTTVKARLLHPVIPGDQIRITAEPIKVLSEKGIVKVGVTVGERTAAEGEIGFSAMSAKT